MEHTTKYLASWTRDMKRKKRDKSDEMKWNGLKSIKKLGLFDYFLTID
jgi:hypothetical protein